MTTAPDPPQLRTVLALRRLGSALAATNRAVGGALGIKDTDLAVLDVLHQEGPLTPTQLARRTRTHPATMTGVLGRLERGGWIERRPDAADRRSVRIRAAGVSGFRADSRPVRAIPPAPSPRPPPARRLILIRGIRRRPSDGGVGSPLTVSHSKVGCLPVSGSVGVGAPTLMP